MLVALLIVPNSLPPRCFPLAGREGPWVEMTEKQISAECSVFRIRAGWPGHGPHAVSGDLRAVHRSQHLPWGAIPHIWGHTAPGVALCQAGRQNVTKGKFMCPPHHKAKKGKHWIWSKERFIVGPSKADWVADAQENSQLPEGFSKAYLKAR